MSSIIMHFMASTTSFRATAVRADVAVAAAAPMRRGGKSGPDAALSGVQASNGGRDVFLQQLGERVRTLRARRGLTRKALAASAGVSERHLANLESGVGNASILVLRQVAIALDCPLMDVVGDAAHDSAERLLIEDLLNRRSEDELQAARHALMGLFDEGGSSGSPTRRLRIALIGLRGAGKSSLGARLAQALGVAFVELSRDIERLAGCRADEIHALYGQAAYRRYERRALEAALAGDADAVIATPGGIVAEPATFNRLLAHCTTVWVQASPDEHMQRVMAQGDLRPMAGNREAMDDLRRILDGRAAFYAKADRVLDTQGATLDEAFDALRALVADLRPSPQPSPARGRGGANRDASPKDAPSPQPSPARGRGGANQVVSPKDTPSPQHSAAGGRGGANRAASPKDTPSPQHSAAGGRGGSNRDASPKAPLAPRQRGEGEGEGHPRSKGEGHRQSMGEGHSRPKSEGRPRSTHRHS
jgi:XRE family transcriptional regulator, aerobic/anaerobic benzoate catabolism transcriptional regulator